MDTGLRCVSGLMVVLLAVTLTGCNLVKSIFVGPSIATKKVPNAVVGISYDAKIEVSGAYFSSVWISAGTLPPGLEFHDGHVRGIPTAGGSYTFEVFASDTSDEFPKTDSRRYTVLVLDITTTRLDGATANRSYGPSNLTTVGEVGGVVWAVSSGSLPDGIVLSGAGQLTGSATDGGNFEFTLSATDHDSPPRKKEQAFALVIQNPVPSISGLAPSSAPFGTSSFTLEVSGADFVKSSRVLWDSGERPTEYVDRTRLNAAIPATDIASAGTASIAVSSPEPGGGLSNLLTFAIAGTGAASALIRISVDSAGAEADGPSGKPSLSADGRFVAFESSATNLVTGDQNGVSDIFLRDTCRNAGAKCQPSTIRISSTDDGSEANGPSFRPSISADGRYVAFTSLASNLVSEDENSSQDIFLRDTCIGAEGDCRPGTTRLSVGTTGLEADGDSDFPSLSATGRYVAYSSRADNLGADDTNRFEDVFLRDTCIGSTGYCSRSTLRVSIDENGKEFAGNSSRPTLYANGRLVVFVAPASGDSPTNASAHAYQAYVRDLCSDALPNCIPSTRAVSRESVRIQGIERAIPSSGRFIALSLEGSEAPPATPGRTEVILLDSCLGAVPDCSPSTGRSAESGSRQPPEDGLSAAIVARTGRYVVFISRASDIVPEDRNDYADVFMLDTCYGSEKCISATWRVSRGPNGLEPDADSADLAVTPDGTVVAFATAATTLSSDDTNHVKDIYVYRRPTRRVPERDF